jgi:CHAD domain-containing protein
LQRERRQAWRTLKRRLDSPTYAGILRRWDAFLEQPLVGATGAANASRPIITVVRKRVRRLCRSIVQLGTPLLAAPDDAQLHALRIACKKLRYVLECYVSLFPGKKTTVLIKHLRRLQDNLGHGHDLFVQQEALRHFATTLSGADLQTYKTLQAIDSLMRHLEEEKQTVGQAFPALFAAFATHIGPGAAA